MLALMAAASVLSIPQAKQAVRVDAKLDHPTNVTVRSCKHLKPNVVHCWLVEEDIEEATPTTIGVISILEGAVTVTLYRGVLRVHRV